MGIQTPRPGVPRSWPARTAGRHPCRNQDYLACGGLAQGQGNADGRSADSDGKPNRFTHFGDVALQHFGSPLVRREAEARRILARAADNHAEDSLVDRNADVRDGFHGEPPFLFLPLGRISRVTMVARTPSGRKIAVSARTNRNRSGRGDGSGMVGGSERLLERKNQSTLCHVAEICR